MTIQNDHIRVLRGRGDWLAARAANNELNRVQQAELRALNWAIDTLQWSVDQAAQSAAKYRDSKLQEFEDRRQERRSKSMLRKLRKVVTAVSDETVLQAVDQHLRDTRGVDA